MNLCVYGFVFVINMKTPSLRSLEDDDHDHNNLDVAYLYIFTFIYRYGSLAGLDKTEVRMNCLLENCEYSRLSRYETTTG